MIGTLTRVIRVLTSSPHHFAAVADGVSRLVALLCGAIAGALLLRFAPLWAPVLPAMLVAAVAAIAALPRRSGYATDASAV